ncbi:MAG TPA: N-acetyltransferase [Erysipelotrichaceae bacterium]|nr:N-acetyltransferase [Erysipelotrichaceae bacterium]
MIEFRAITENEDAAMAEIIRSSLEEVHLDIPGTAYFDASLDHLSRHYADIPDAAYEVMLENGILIAGAGFAKYSGYEKCCELQKLYLSDSVKGLGLGYQMISFLEDKARSLGYRQIYLETHDNLQAAIHIYQKSGYQEIPRPDSVVHSTMNRFFLKQL